VYVYKNGIIPWYLLFFLYDKIQLCKAYGYIKSKYKQGLQERKQLEDILNQLI